MRQNMKRLIVAALALFSAAAFSATLNPVQLLNPAGSTSGQAIVSTGATTPPAWGNVSIATLTGVLPIANGGTGQTSASAALTALGGLSTTTAASTYATIAQATTALAATGGSINGVTVGQAAPLAGGFTTLSASGAVSGVGFTNLLSPYLTAATAATTYAPIAGNAAATFSVGTATTAAHAVRYDQAMGLGQTLQDVTASRALGTAYTNGTTKPITVMVSATSAAVGGTLTVTMGAIVVWGSTASAVGYISAATFVVPVGVSYTVAMGGGGAPTVKTWIELR